MSYKTMTEKQQLRFQHDICNRAKANDFEKVLEILSTNKDAVAELITARPGGRMTIGQQAMWHNNIDAIVNIKALDPDAFYNAWHGPLDAKIAAQETLANPKPREAEWLDKQKAALAASCETIVETANESHVTKATILAFLTNSSLLADQPLGQDGGESEGSTHPPAKKAKK